MTCFSLKHPSMNLECAAAGRPLLIVTPKRHVERLGTLTNEESVDLWRTALGIMRDFKLKNFENMIINHGNNRNHAHMHLKIKPKAWEFEKVGCAFCELQYFPGTSAFRVPSSRFVLAGRRWMGCCNAGALANVRHRCLSQHTRIQALFERSSPRKLLTKLRLE